MNTEHLKIIYEQLPKENQKPLSQLAKQALRTLKVSPDPGGLYLLQLIEWCLDYGKVKLAGPGTTVLKEYLEAFHTWSPARVMQVFLENDNGDPVEIYSPGPVDPVRLAEEALEQLHSRLTAAVQDYPIASPWD
jgi:hypothetical protein